MAKQPYFPTFEKLTKKDFGGTLLKGNAREPRPISIKRPMHLVLKSSLAKNENSFLITKKKRRIEQVIRRASKANDVKLYRFANNGNHLHLIVLPRSRQSFAKFIRTISGLIARIALDAERGNAHGKKFWDARPFTRILDWGRDYRNACAYVLKNTLEVMGFMSHVRRRQSREFLEPG